MNTELDQAFGGEDGVSPIRFGLRDASQVAHHYADEVYVRPVYETFQMSPREQFVDAIGCASQMLGILIAAVLLWLLAFGLFALATNV